MPLNRPLAFTALNSAAIFALGMVTAQKGPAFNDLILITDTDVEGGSFYVMASNCGYMLGSVLAGLLYDRFKTKTVMIAVTLTLSGVCTIFVPWCTAFVAMIFIQVVVSIFSCAYETIINTEEVQAWDGSSESAMQFLSFCYSLGGIFAPLITEPFMAPKGTEITENSNSTFGSSPNVSSLLESSLRIDKNDVGIVTKNNAIHTDGENCMDVFMNCTGSILDTFPYNLSASDHSQNYTVYSVESNVHFAYLITGSLTICVSTFFYFAHCKFHIKKQKEKEKEDADLPTCRKIPRKVCIAVVAIGCVYFFFLTMGIDSFAQYLFYFVVNYLDWSKKDGAFSVSLFWGLSMCLKLILVVVYRRVGVGLVLLIGVLGMVAASTLFSIAAQFHMHVLVWISLAFLALSQSTAFGGFMSWFDGNIMKLTGKVTSALMISTGVGALVPPLPLGFLMKEISLMSLPYFVTVQLYVCGGIFLVLNFVAKPVMNKKYGPLRPAETDPLQDKADASLVDSGNNVETSCVEA